MCFYAGTKLLAGTYKKLYNYILFLRYSHFLKETISIYNNLLFKFKFCHHASLLFHAVVYLFSVSLAFSGLLLLSLYLKARLLFRAIGANKSAKD